MFDQLPETIPVKNKKQERAVAVSVLVHVGLVSLFIAIQMFAPGRLAGVELLTSLYLAPGPPPAPLPPPPPPAAERPSKGHAEKPANETPRLEKQAEPVKPAEQPQLIQPVEVPKDIARTAEAAPGAGGGGVIGGVPGGVIGGIPGGIPGGALGGVLGGVASAPPPVATKEPLRVGGAIREPKITKMVQPTYPEAAVRQHVEGVVVLEATVTESGQVEKVKVISGPPALVDAALQAVRQWRYEPTILNGSPVAVLLTAHVNFSLKNAPR